MSTGLSFDYGICSIGDIAVDCIPNPSNTKRKIVNHLVINDEMVIPTARFWNSLCSRFSEFGLTHSLYNLYDHAEVFTRLAERSPNDRIRYTIERQPMRPPVLLAATSPERPLIGYEQLTDILKRFGGERVTYHNGSVNSIHTPRIGATKYKVGCSVTGLEHEFENRFLLDVPIDGYGKPAVFPSVERVHDRVFFATRNAPALKQELSIGKGLDVVHHAVIRALDSFNTDEGYAALRNRIQTAMDSWMSVFETSNSYKLLVKELTTMRIIKVAEDDVKTGIGLITEFHKITGDTSRLYGLATMDALAAKKQRNLPVNCTVYDMLGFLANIATHRATEQGRFNFQCFIGQMLGDKDGYDLESTRTLIKPNGQAVHKWAHFSDFRLKGTRQSLMNEPEPADVHPDWVDPVVG